MGLHQSTINMSAAELAARLEGVVHGDAAARVTHLDAADRAASGALTFVRAAKFAHGWRLGNASVALVSKAVPLDAVRVEIPGRAVVVVGDADAALSSVLEWLSPVAAHARGAHTSAVVEAGASVDPSASVGPLCHVGAGAIIGAGAVLVSGCFVGRGATIGAGTVLQPRVAVMDGCVIGERCLLHAGVVIGADGFGFRPGPSGLAKVPHIGNVVIGDDVEIGANSCVDRAKFGSTTIGNGTKIDNLVQVAHNCRIGRHCVICAEVGLAGSVILGDGVVLGGKVGVGDGVEIGARSSLAAGSLVHSDVPPGSVYMGAPAGPASEWRRTYAALRRMGKRRGGGGESAQKSGS